jgi:hypothetical protein
LLYNKSRKKEEKMERINLNNIPQDKPLAWGDFLLKREFPRDVLKVARFALTFAIMSGCSSLDKPRSIVKLGALLSLRIVRIEPSAFNIRLDLGDIKDQVGLARGAIEHRNPAVLAQNLGRLANRVIIAVTAVATFYGGVAALRGTASFGLPMIWTTAQEVIIDLLTLRTCYLGRYLEREIAKKSDKELLEWIKEQVKIGREEEQEITLKSKGPSECNARMRALEDQKKQWLRDAMGDEALNLALREIDPSAESAVAKRVRYLIKVKKAANLCNLISSLFSVTAVLLLYQKGGIKKYAFLLYALTVFIDSSGVALHRPVARKVFDAQAA